MKITDCYTQIIESTGEKVSRAGLKDTPKRAAKAFEFMTRDSHKNLDDVINGALFPSDANEMVIV